MSAKPAGEVAALNALLTGAYVSLHTGDPTALNEVSGGSYSRVLLGAYTITGSNPSVATNDTVLEFPTATAGWGELSHFGIWDAASGGNLLIGDPVDVAKTIGAGDIARFLAGELSIQVT